jgi:hypothetical protein
MGIRFTDHQAAKPPFMRVLVEALPWADFGPIATDLPEGT